jgi:hypothetical protein
VSSQVWAAFCSWERTQSVLACRAAGLGFEAREPLFPAQRTYKTAAPFVRSGNPAETSLGQRHPASRFLEMTGPAEQIHYNANDGEHMTIRESCRRRRWPSLSETSLREREVARGSARHRPGGAAWALEEEHHTRHLLARSRRLGHRLRGVLVTGRSPRRKPCLPVTAVETAPSYRDYVPLPASSSSMATDDLQLALVGGIAATPMPRTVSLRCSSEQAQTQTTSSRRAVVSSSLRRFRRPACRS